jgi:YVTN family beta-propeller protein
MAVLKSVDIGNAKMNDTWDSVVDRICLDSGEQTAYVTSGDNIELIAVDLVGLRVMARVPLVSGRTFSVPARGLAMTPDDRQIFVTAGGTNRIYVIDTHLNRIVDSVQVDNCPSELVMSQDGKKLYVLQQHTSNAITVVDAVTHKVVRGVNVLNGIAASVDFELFPDERTAYILCFDPNCLLVYDLEETDIHKARKSVTVSGLDPFNVAASSQKRYLFITNFSSDYVTIFDTQLNAVVSTIQLNNSITGLQSASIVKNFDLSQNYPNPFNPSTAIQYSLATEGHVSLRLYDVLGRLMMVLKDGCEQAGKHTVTVDASRLSSGVYFYQLQAVDASAGSARSFVETKKMVLIR